MRKRVRQTVPRLTRSEFKAIKQSVKVPEYLGGTERFQLKVRHFPLLKPSLSSSLILVIINNADLRWKTRKCLYSTVWSSRIPPSTLSLLDLKQLLGDGSGLCFRQRQKLFWEMFNWTKVGLPVQARWSSCIYQDQIRKVRGSEEWNEEEEEEEESGGSREEESPWQTP